MVLKMQITDVRLRKVNSENRMKAVAPNGEFKDIAHPINAETREKIQKAILEAYEAPETEETTDTESAE